MAKVAFVVVVILAVVINLAGWIMEKVYKKKMTEKAEQNKNNNY